MSTRIGRYMLLISVFVAGMCFAYVAKPTEWLQGTAAAQPGCQAFSETGKSICGRFQEYWNQNGGLAQQGLPLSGEFTEVNDLDGKSYTVQYFERAVFEKHPELARPFDVLLSQLGTFQFKRKYPNGEPGGTTPPPPAGGIIGQVIEVNDLSDKDLFRVEVIDSKEATSIPASGPWDGGTAKGKFVLVAFKATNVSNAPATMESYYLRLKDNMGRTFDISDDMQVILAAAELYNVETPGTSIQPNSTENFMFVYDVATDAAGYLLVER